jgi:CheY-like chemotaxis protein
MREALTRAGYRVLVAENGSEALETATAYPGGLQLLITDVVMPGMNGFELAERLRSVRPGLRVLFISGLSRRGARARGDRSRGARAGEAVSDGRARASRARGAGSPVRRLTAREGSNRVQGLRLQQCADLAVQS